MQTEKSSKPNKQQNISLIIGLSIPVLMMLFVALAINAPQWFTHVKPPQQDFLYSSGNNAPYTKYLVKEGKLTRVETTLPEGATRSTENDIHFFIHDVSANSSREISETEALKLSLNGNILSDDGFSMQSGRRGGWFLFGYGRDYRSRYLVKDNYSVKLNLINKNPQYRYYWNTIFIGWLKQNG